MNNNRTNVYITIDVETSVGGALDNTNCQVVPLEKRIFCQQGNSEWGIGFISKELKRSGLNASFFLEVFASKVFGDTVLKRASDIILENGNDIQIHLHPVFYRYADFFKNGGELPSITKEAWPDAMTTYDEKEQFHLLEEGINIFKRITGISPVAFRAGGYMANKTTLKCLSKVGIYLDTSFNPLYPWSFENDNFQMNRPNKCGDVWSIPISVFKTHFPDTSSFKALEISSISFSEMRTVLETISKQSVGHIVIMLHSFSMVKPVDIAYSKIKPDKVVIKRFQKLLEYLNNNREVFRVSTFKELAVHKESLTIDQPGITPDIGYIKPVIRKGIQAVNRLYWV